jgi:hypothetical protein
MHMQVVDEAAPPRIVVERNMHEPHDTATFLGEDRLTPRRRHESRCPHSHPIRDHVTVEERVGVRTAVMPTPTVGMQPSHLLGVLDPGRAK